jgi:hypothetical protein
LQAQEQTVYILGDGDRVRERIEALLLAGDLEALRLLSQQLSNAIMRLAQELERTMAAEIIVSAGDDLLVRVPARVYNREALEELSELYKSSTGGSISFGAGFTIETAYLNLRRAKSSSKQKIFETFESMVP